MSTNYGNPYLYPGYNMIKVDLQIKQEFIKKRQMTFEEALDEFFKCKSCGGVLNLKKNEKSQKAFAKQIDKMKKEMRS